MNNNPCPVCLSERMLSVAHEAYQCDECLHTFINYKGDGLNYHKEDYRKNNFGSRVSSEINSEGEFTENFHKARETMCAKRLQKIKPLLEYCSTCLDIGAGGGTFAKKLKQNSSVDIECQEISDVCIDNLESYGFKTHKGDFCSIDFKKVYDLTTCWHVLEHIKDLNLFSKKAAQACNKYLVVEVPINRTLRNPDNGWDGHYHYFSRRSMAKLFEKNFDILEITEGIQKPALLAVLKNKKPSIT
jgi:hypothetical protein